MPRAAHSLAPAAYGATYVSTTTPLGAATYVPPPTPSMHARSLVPPPTPSMLARALVPPPSLMQLGTAPLFQPALPERKGSFSALPTVSRAGYPLPQTTT